MALLNRRKRKLPKEAELRRLHESLSLATSKAPDSSRGLLAIVRKLCNIFDWSFGEAWVPSRDGSVLKPGPAWPRANPDYRGFHQVRRRLGFLPGGGLVGRTWQRRVPLWCDDLAKTDPGSFSRRGVALRAGFRSGVGIPVLSGLDVVAVLVFFRTETGAEDEALLELMTRAVAPLGPVVARKQVEVELAVREKQQQAVARLGLHALASDTGLDTFLLEATRVAAATLRVDHCKLLELQSDDTFVLRAGVGWSEGLVGQCWFEGSQAGYTVEQGDAVIVQDLDRDDRFEPSQLLCDHHIVSGLSVIVHGHTSPYGVLAVHGRLRRSFTRDDVHFLQAVANVVGTALESDRAQREIHRHRDELEVLVQERTRQLEASHERLRIAERLASIGTLAAGLGHDLNNTILPVLCRLDALEKGSLPEGARDDLAAVRHAVEYLRQLSQGLRFFSLDPENAGVGSTDLRDWWASVHMLLRNAVPQKIDLISDFEPDLPRVAVPAHRLSQAVLNLVANAAEAIEGEGTVRVWAEQDLRGWVCLGVTDNGKGMCANVRRHSLDPFFTTKTRGISTGLGLALVHAIAQSCGGTVDIESEEGQGTTVMLTLPEVEASGDVAEESAPKPAVATISISDPRISSYAALLVQSAGLAVVEGPRGEPGEGRLWITEPSDQSLPAARRFLAADQRRRVVFYGELDHAEREARCVVVDKAGGPDVMRRSLRDVVYQVIEG